MQHNGYVQYGCGLCAPASWTNFDASPTPRLQRIPLIGSVLRRRGPKYPRNIYYGDVTKGLPIAPSSCDAIYCSHTLEHLALEDLRKALRNTYEYLKPNGLFRSVQPDLEYLFRQYSASTSEQPALQFMEASDLGYRRRPRGLEGRMREWLGHSRHLWLWDYRSLEAELRNIGFTDIRRASFGDCPDIRFRDVEDAGRWENCLGVECRKKLSEANSTIASRESA